VGFVVGLVVGLAVGIFGNLVASYLWEGPIAHVRLSRRLDQAERDSLSYPSASDHMYEVCSWGPHRELTPRNLRTVVVSREPNLKLVDPDKWRQAMHEINERGDVHGRCGYITAAGPLDWREGPSTEFFRITLTPTDYSTGIATYIALNEDPPRQREIIRLLKENPAEFVAQAPPSHLAVNVGVLSADGQRFLGVHRSAAVATSPNIWTCGPCETLKVRDDITPGEDPEDFFKLTERCLVEEIGLAPDEYERMSVSWFGYYGPDAHPWITAQARVKLSDNEVKERWHTCHSRPEADDIDWFTFDRTTIETIIFAPRGSEAGRFPTAFAHVADGECAGRWLIHAPHALHEMWRMRALLRG
jgi:hypothetical protein